METTGPGPRWGLDYNEPLRILVEGTSIPVVYLWGSEK